MMRIAVISDYGLPDPWVERAINTLLKNDFRVFIIGKFKGSTGITDLSQTKIYDIPVWDAKIRAKIFPYYHWMKKRIKNILKEINPDVVLTINIFAGIMIHELGYPMVLADLESYGLKRPLGLGILKGTIFYRELFILKKIWKYESVLVDHPIIVVTKPSYVYYRYHLGASTLGLLKAYPLKNENWKANGITPPREHINFIFIGKEISQQIRPVKHDRYRRYISNARIIKPTIEILSKIYKENKNFKLIVVGDKNLESSDFINSVGYLKQHIDIYKYIAMSHYGICTYQPSLVHIRGSINRVYMYTLQGLPVIITSTYIDVIDDLDKYAIIIDSINYKNSMYEAFLSLIKEFNYDEYIKYRSELMNYSKRNLIWEKQEHVLNDLLKKA